MDGFKDFWRGLGRSARAGFVGGVLAILALVTALGVWAVRTEYGVLFSDLAQSDLAAMAGELDKMKVPYKVGPEGSSLLVPDSVVHKTRVALMGRDLPLHGAVGLELFNNMEFGVSEFVQKVNYQRALQGELTRTILAIDEVQSARVHLALAEQSLFRKDAGKSKASVTITVKPGRALQPAQVQGIQRLVAASVADVQAQDVTVLDQHGVALSRGGTSGDGAMADSGAAQLDMKRGIEAYLAQKAGKVLDRMFGAGQSVVSVDAVFSQEQTRVTTEEVLGAKSGDASQPMSGVVLRERQTTRDNGGDAGHGTAPTVTNIETDYQTGKRTEQVVSPAGALKQLNVAVVLKRALPDAELQRVRELVATAVGLNRSRGDVVTVHSMDQLQEEDAKHAAPSEESTNARPRVPAAQRERSLDSRVVVYMLGALLGVLACGVMLGTRLRGRATAVRAPALTEAERARMLQAVQGWLTHEPAGGDTRVERR